MTALLSAHALSLRYRKKSILQALDFELFPQEIVFLMGDNGAGKTSLLHLLLGLKSATSGRIERHIPLHDLAYVPDFAPLYPSLTVLQSLQFCSQLYRCPTEALPRVTQQCALERVLALPCAHLSHGYRQRLALAQAFIRQPRLLLLDELHNGLDQPQKEALRPMLQDLKRDCSLLMIAHDWQEAAQLADRVFYLHEGALHVLSLPPRKPQQLWLKLQTEARYAYQKRFPQALISGSYIALDEQDKNEALSAFAPAVEALFPHYPAAALLEQLKDVRDVCRPMA